MFVITADQIDSSHRADLAGAALADLNARYGDALALPVDRNAGDEIQAILENSDAALSLALDLLRTRNWSVGLGIGSVRTPLPANTREAAGNAFVAARAAIGSAKKAPHRFALEVFGAPDTDLPPLVDLLLFVRSKRSSQGWELYDLLAQGLSQAEAAKRLGISQAATSLRARAGGIRAELDALGPLARLLERADLDQQPIES
jgi:hypothetical protein